MMWAEIEELVQCSYYEVNKISMNGEHLFTQTEPFTIMSVIDGEGCIDGEKIQKGDHFILTANYGQYKLSGNMQLITSHI